MNRNEIIEKLKTVSTLAGIYLWKDEQQNILYVGKAKNLRKRMNQYFDGAINSYKTSKLVSLIADFETIICKSNKEALLLEKSLIDKYNPEFNILLLDDRKYPYLKVQLLKDGINISLSRKVLKDESENIFFYGPFPIGYGSVPILKLLQHEALFENGLKIKNNDPLFWKKQFNNIKNILSFKNNNYLSELENRMIKAANNEQFELAMFLRDGLMYLKKLRETQIVELNQYKNIDVFVFKTEKNTIFSTILFYRYGALINKINLTIPISVSINDSLAFFFEEFYKDNIVPNFFLIENETLFRSLDLPDSYIFVEPKKGTNKKILDLALLNLNDFYNKEHINYSDRLEKAQKMLDELNHHLNLQSLKNIVLFDNSNLNNTNPVGVAVVYTNGIKNKSLYRKFNHSLDIDRHSDVEYMKQSINKFFNSERNNKNIDLIIVDGGLAQINEAKKALLILGIKIPVIGLVKDENHRTKSLIDLNLNEIQINNLDLYNFLSEMQIEVDRFAKKHHTNRQKISSLEGKLRNIKGLGPKMEQKLLAYFKNYANIYDASIEELQKIVPINIATKINKKEY
ncbi:excinuclease ABC subunit UvrC [Mycoplasmopsis primatum]|uniref:excinuclease ABC subunit UvrC n=1 Tax=Mycoplasmopsis primatum TaxID=55604 RepID=UPI0004950C57|nr:excinuclease ABC subunit UvrC [Mycoplasmopsis primatum]